MKNFEKLGVFYLGRTFDTDAGATKEDLLLYDAKDLTTHAVVVGMTGSGKTGLCVSLLEEAAIDNIPAIAIDPKGDLGNLLLTFPKLRPADFLPWVDEGEAGRKGFTTDEYARKVSETWRKGLESWGQGGERIARLRASADLAIYTPGSSTGTPLSVLRSFDAPPQDLLEDTDALRERVLSAVSGLLALLGIDADPIRSREHILLSNILNHAWSQGKNLDLASLIREIQAPPFEQIGVLDLESFYPTKDRFELAMTLNNLLASPGFAAWMEGEPLQVPRLLWTPEGKPRIAILYIAHLSEAERMFFVTLLLNEVVSWIRTQPGTSSLRALLYMDEVFGYFPPTANPPSKTPMLTLLKQARAYGLGVVLATQNPVDLDYKGLSNTGTWFLGRLQTERDKARILDGLEGASSQGGGAFDRGKTEAVLSGLKSRVFLMNNVHDNLPQVSYTLWAMSYLRRPLTRQQINCLTKLQPRPDAGVAVSPARAPQKIKSGAAERERPMLPPDVTERFVSVASALSGGEKLVYRPALLGAARLHYVKTAQDLDLWDETALLAPLPEDDVPKDPWADADTFEDPLSGLEDEPLDAASFSALPSEATQAKKYKTWSKSLISHVYRQQTLTFWKCKALKSVSKPGESEGDFRVRLAQTAREKRDLAVEKLRKRYAPKLTRMEERIRKAEERLDREKDQLGQQKMQTAVSVGATLLGALLGRKAVSRSTVGRATTAMRGVGRIGREKQDITRARENIEALRRRLSDLEAEFEEEIAELQEEHDPAAIELTSTEIRPRKADIQVTNLLLAWVPWKLGSGGIAEPVHK
jgi:hypothetical protein